MEKTQSSRKVALPLSLHREIAILETYLGLDGPAHVFEARLHNLPALIGELMVAGETDPGFFRLEIPFTMGGGPLQDLEDVGSIRLRADLLWREYREQLKNKPEVAAKNRERYLHVIDYRLLENPQVAIRIPSKTGGSSTDVARMVAEDKALRRLNHRNILRRFAWIDEPHVGPCLVVEQVRGKTIDRVLRRRVEQRQGPLPLSAVAHIAYQLVLALSHAHDNGVTHGDLFLRRVQLEEPTKEELETGKAKGIVKVGGFGSTGASGVVALHYQAPEQIRSGEATPQSDVYQLGAMLYLLATGKSGYESVSPEELRERVTGGEPHPSRVHHFRPDISQKFEALIEGAREKDLRKRWPLHRVLEEITQLYATRVFSLEDGPKATIAEELLQRVQSNVALKDFYRAIEALDLVRDFMDGVGGEKGLEVHRRHDALSSQCEPYRGAVEALKKTVRDHIAPVDHLMEELYTRYGNGEPLLSDADKGILKENGEDVVILKRSLLDGILEHTAAAINELSQMDAERIGDMHRKMVDRASSQEVACSDLAARLVKFGEDYLKR